MVAGGGIGAIAAIITLFWGFFTYAVPNLSALSGHPSSTSSSSVRASPLPTAANTSNIIPVSASTKPTAIPTPIAQATDTAEAQATATATTQQAFSTAVANAVQATAQANVQATATATAAAAQAASDQQTQACLGGLAVFFVIIVVFALIILAAAASI